MAEMNGKRVSEIKCTFCGSRLKKRILLENQDGAEIGYALHCCNCGHIDTFAYHTDAIHSVVGYKQKVGKEKYQCGYDPDKIVNCTNMTCPFRPRKNVTKEVTAKTVNGQVRASMAPEPSLNNGLERV